MPNKIYMPGFQYYRHDAEFQKMYLLTSYIPFIRVTLYFISEQMELLKFLIDDKITKLKVRGIVVQIYLCKTIFEPNVDNFVVD